MGKSMSNSTTVRLILNPEPGHISPQFHVVYDKLFSTVYGTVTHGVFDADQWQGPIELRGEEHCINPNNHDDPTVLSREIEHDESDLDVPLTDRDPPTLRPVNSDSDSDSCISEGEDPEMDNDERIRRPHPFTIWSQGLQAN